MYTTTVETYNPSLQTLDNDESELSEEDYNTPTDVDTSEKEIVSTKLGKQAKRERERERGIGGVRGREANTAVQSQWEEAAIKREN